MYIYVYSTHSTHQVNGNKRVNKLLAVKMSVLESTCIFTRNISINILIWQQTANTIVFEKLKW